MDSALMDSVAMGSVAMALTMTDSAAMGSAYNVSHCSAITIVVLDGNLVRMLELFGSVGIGPLL